MSHPPAARRGLLGELRRRHVFRVAGIYLLVGWALIQVADTVFPHLRLPEWSVALVIALTVVGFPIALVLAWAFEITPEGIRLAPAATPAAAGSGRRAIASPAAAEPSARTRLIVLPFRALRADPETDFLAFSLPDAITVSLSGLESLIVRSNLAALRFAADAPDLATIAAEAEVDVVLSGTLLRAGEQLRVSTQLTATADGTLLWSQVSQVSLGDLFELQDQLARRILESLQLPLTDRDRHRLRRDVPADPRAYELYLRANQVAHQVDGWNTARDLYLQSLAADPDYAPTWARLGRCYRLIGKYSPDPIEVRDSLERAEAAFRRALELNPDLPLAHNLYAQLEVDLGRAPEAMVRLLSRARAGGADPEIFAGLVHACRFCGLLDASLAAHQRARGLDPTIATSVAHTYWMRGDHAHALEWTFGDIGYMPGLALASLGRDREAIESLRERERQIGDARVRSYLTSLRTLLEGRRQESLAALEIAGRALRDGEALYYLTRSYARLGERERALADLERVVQGGFACPQVLRRDPWLDPLRGSPAFEAVLAAAERRHRAAVEAFRGAGGEAVLVADGPVVQGC